MNAGLDRFVDAQASVYEQVLQELHAGRKRSHWMWFVFPQLKGLGHSSTAIFFGLDGLKEAQAYWAHPVLGTRLKECVELVRAIRSRTAHEIFDSPDDLKFRSCLTLFEVAAQDKCFGWALQQFYQARRDPSTLSLLGLPPDSPPA